jgi:hypothetical protein
VPVHTGRGMKRKQRDPDNEESSDQGEEVSEAQSESLEVTGSEASGSGEEGDANNDDSEGEEESEEEDSVRFRISECCARTCDRTEINLFTEAYKMR